MRVLILGSINKDYVYSVDHIVCPGETISCFDSSIYWGGKGFNQAVAISKGGADASFACKIQLNDKQEVNELLEKHGIHNGYIQTESVPTGQAIIQIDRSGQNCIIVCPGANRTISNDFIDKVLGNFSKDDVLLLQNEINNLPYIMQKASELCMHIVFNPSPFEANILKLPLSLVDTFILNEIECREFTGESDYTNMKNKMKVLFPNAKLVLTLGKLGVIYSGDNACLTHGIYDVPVVDTTAAGDTFTGFFVANYYKTYDPEESLRIASIASSLAVSRKGAIPSIPDINEVLSSSIKYIKVLDNVI